MKQGPWQGAVSRHSQSGICFFYALHRHLGKFEMPLFRTVVIKAVPRVDNSPPRNDWAAGVKQGVLIAAVLLALTLPPAQPVTSSQLVVAAASLSQTAPRHADFLGEHASKDARFVADWVADSRDNQMRPFVVIDKKNTRIFVFDANARLVGATPVLLGAAVGDDSVVGIGQRPIKDVLPQERTTPAGRFVSEPGRNDNGEDVIWVDYDAAVSMHRVRVADLKERRLERLATADTDDNRISFGCINVPVAFYENVLNPQFRPGHGVIYVLPEVKSVREVFTTAYDPARKSDAV